PPKSWVVCAAAPARGIRRRSQESGVRMGDCGGAGRDRQIVLIKFNKEEAHRAMKKIWIGAVLAGALTLFSCGGDKPAETAKSEGAAPAGGTATPDEANGGTVTGKVAFTGDKPK